MMTNTTNPSCGELGACQRQAPRCQGCTGSRHDTTQLPQGGFVFAPGVIEGPRRRAWLTDRRVEQLARIGLALACLAALFSTLAIASGLLHLKGVL